jgi:hypothetical protein
MAIPSRDWAAAPATRRNGIASRIMVRIPGGTQAIAEDRSIITNYSGLGGEDFARAPFPAMVVLRKLSGGDRGKTLGTTDEHR